MKSTLHLIAFSIFILLSTNIDSQDVFFSQYENTPLNLNPSLTGNFDGKARLFLNYRNQWPSLLKQASYKTGSISLDSKFKIGNSSKLGLGFNTLFDRAGNLNFESNRLNFLTSIMHDFIKTKNSYHSISLGFNFSFINQQFDIEKAKFPGQKDSLEEYNSKIHFFDFSTGLSWDYKSNSRLSFQLGASINNINRPNISFGKSNEHKLNVRFNLHGNSELPLFKEFSLIPSFMYISQGNYDILTLGLATKWYFKPESFSNYFQIGIQGRKYNDYSGKSRFNTYILTAIIDLKAFSIGLSYDHFLNIDDGAYELSIGYIISN